MAKWPTVAFLAGGVVTLDLWTKSWALAALAEGPQPGLLGGWVPFTLAFNKGAAFGLRIGSDPRMVFVPLTLVAIGLLLVMVGQAERKDWLRILAGSLVLGGALGNLYDRVRWDQGVVDFLGPVDLGFMLWPIFNVADMGITVGALLLAVSFWREEIEPRSDEPESENPGERPDEEPSALGT